MKPNKGWYPIHYHGTFVGWARWPERKYHTFHRKRRTRCPGK